MITVSKKYLIALSFMTAIFNFDKTFVIHPILSTKKLRARTDPSLLAGLFHRALSLNYWGCGPMIAAHSTSPNLWYGLLEDCLPWTRAARVGKWIAGRRKSSRYTLSSRDTSIRSWIKHAFQDRQKVTAGPPLPIQDVLGIRGQIDKFQERVMSGGMPGVESTNLTRLWFAGNSQLFNQ